MYHSIVAHDITLQNHHHVSCSAHDASTTTTTTTTTSTTTNISRVLRTLGISIVLVYSTGSLAPALLQCSPLVSQSLLRRRCGRALPLHLPHRRPWYHAPRGAIHRLPIIRHDHAPATWQPSLELSALGSFLRSVAVPVGDNTSLFLNSSCVCPEPVLAKRSFLCKMVPEKGAFSAPVCDGGRHALLRLGAVTIVAAVQHSLDHIPCIPLPPRRGSNITRTRGNIHDSSKSAERSCQCHWR
jgi:hypothetical protein